MRTLAYSMATMTILHAAALLGLFYYWALTNEPPPFVDGRPLKEVAFGLGVTSFLFGAVAGIAFEDLGKR